MDNYFPDSKELQPENENDPTPNCIVCLKVAEKRCSRCKYIHYCSDECQIANWNEHKKFCTKIYKFVNGKMKVQTNENEMAELNDVLSDDSIEQVNSFLSMPLDDVWFHVEQLCNMCTYLRRSYPDSEEIIKYAFENKKKEAFRLLRETKFKKELHFKQFTKIIAILVSVIYKNFNYSFDEIELELRKRNCNFFLMPQRFKSLDAQMQEKTQCLDRDNKEKPYQITGIACSKSNYIKSLQKTNLTTEIILHDLKENTGMLTINKNDL